MTENLNHYGRQAFDHLSQHGRLKPACFAILLVLMALLLAGCHNDENKKAAPPRPVRVMQAPVLAAGTLLTRTGEVRAHEELPLAFRLDGRLLSRQVDVGDRVKAGELLASLERDTGQNQLSSALADLNSARAAEHVAALTLNRMQQLMPAGAISRSQLDSARGDWQAAVARRQSSESAWRNARDNLSWTQLQAPQDGVITAVSASPGQVLGAGSTVVTLAASDSRDAVFDVADPHLIAQNAATPFTVSLLSDPEVHATARLRDISPQADPQTRTWHVRLTLIDPPAALALGANVQIAQAQSGPGVMTLPAAALTRIEGKPAVFIVDRQSLRLQIRPVTLASYSATDVAIASGIQPGDTIVIAGVSKLRDQERVTLAEGEE